MFISGHDAGDFYATYQYIRLYTASTNILVHIKRKREFEPGKNHCILVLAIEGAGW